MRRVNYRHAQRRRRPRTTTLAVWSLAASMLFLAWMLTLIVLSSGTPLVWGAGEAINSITGGAG